MIDSLDTIEGSFLLRKKNHLLAQVLSTEMLLKFVLIPIQEFMRSEGRPINIQLTVLTEGSETAIFRSYFDDWPEKVEIKLYEEGRGKVAGSCTVSESKIRKR